MKKVFLFLFFCISIYAKDMVVGFDKNMHPRFTQKEGKLAVNILAEEILKTWIKRSHFSNFKTKNYNSTQSLIKDYLDKKIDVILVSPNDFVRFYEQISQNTSQNISIKHYKDNLIELGYVVYSNKAKKPLLYWENKKATCSDNYLPYDFMNLYLLRKYKKSINDFFSNIHKTKTDGLSIMDVFFKKYDIAIVTKQSYDLSVTLNPQIKKKLSFIPIVQYPDTPIFVSFNNSVPKLDVDFMKESMKNVFNSARGEQVKSLLQVEKISEIPDKDLNFIIDSYRELKKLSEKY